MRRMEPGERSVRGWRVVLTLLSLGASCLMACGQETGLYEDGGPAAPVPSSFDVDGGAATPGAPVPEAGAGPGAMDITFERGGCPGRQICIQGFYFPVCALETTGSPPACGAGNECKSGQCIDVRDVGRQCAVECAVDGAPPTVDIVGRVVDQGADGVIALTATTPLSGVRVCVEDRPETCVPTDGVGAYALGAVDNQGPLWLTYERAGYASARQYVGEAVPADLRAQSLALAPVGSALASLGGADPGTPIGQIHLVALTLNVDGVDAPVAVGSPLTPEELDGPRQWIGVAGATVSLDVPPGATFYVDEGGPLTTEPQATSPTGLVALSGVLPGPRRVDVTSAAGKPCFAISGAPYNPSQGGPALTDVRAGFVTTNLALLCPR